MKHLLILALMATPLLSNAQTEATKSTAKEESLMAKLEASKFDLMVIADTKLSKNSDYDVNGVANENVVYLGYNMTKNDNIRLDSSIYTTNTDETETSSDWTGIGFRYKRKNILTEEKHGLNLSSEVRYQMNPSDVERESQVSGYISPRINLNKKISDKVSLNLNLREYEYIRTNSNVKNKRRYYRALFSTSVGITDSITAGVLLDYVNLKYDDSAERKTKEYIGILPSVSYSFTQKLSMDLYWDATPFTSTDDKLFAQDWAKSAAFGATLVYSVF